MNFFKRKNKSTEIIELNQEKLSNQMREIGDRLSEYKDDPALKDILNLIKVGKDLAILSCASAKDDKDRVFSQSKVESYNDIQHFIEVSINRKVVERREGKKPVSGTFNAFRRASNQANSAV